MKKRRSKTDATAGDKRHQAYRNRAAMLRVYESAVMAAMNVKSSIRQQVYWEPVGFHQRFKLYGG